MKADVCTFLSRIVALTLIEQGDVAEYYDLVTGEPCGDKSINWTAAMVIEALTRSKEFE